MHKIRFLLGQNRALPQFPPGELTALPDLLGLAVFKRTTSEGREKEQGRRRKGRGKGKERNEGGGQPQIFWLGTAPPELRPWTILSYLPSESSSDAHDQSMECCGRSGVVISTSVHHVAKLLKLTKHPSMVGKEES